MRQAPRTTDGKNLTRWLPQLERLETRETPAVTASLSQVATWNELGPNVVSNGQVRNISSPDPNGGGAVNNAVIGAISDLLPHPTNPAIMFAGTPNGGVWRSTNANTANPTWVPLTDGIASLSVSSLAFDPATPNRLIVGIGSVADGAEADTAGGVRGDLIGVLVSDNALAPNPTWQIVNGNGALARRSVVGVAINGNTMLVATTSGLFRSTNGGATFTNFFSSTVNNGVTYQTRLFNSRVYDLALNPRLPNQFYLATEPLDGRGREVWRTDDGGATWGTVTDYLQMQLSANTTSVKISVRDTGLIDNQVYVSVVNTFPPDGTPQQFLPGIGAEFAWHNRQHVVSSISWSTNQGGNWTRMDNPRRLTAPEGLDLGERTQPLGGPDQRVGGGLRDDGGRILVVTDQILRGQLFGDGFPHRLKTGDWVHIGGVQEYPIQTPRPQDEIFDLNNGRLNFYQVEVVDDYSFYLLNVAVPGAPMDSRIAYYQRVVDATPGEAGFMDIVAAPSNLVLPNSQENILYMGGDFSQYRFDASNTANPGFGGPYPESFTGSVWQGNRFTVPAGPSPANLARGFANQWANFTDGGAGGTSAPGGDTREMVFDASGNLWVATGTGVYRRSTTAGSAWENASGNIRVGQFWGVGYDTFNNRAVGATQDTGIVEQDTAGSPQFTAPLDPFSRNLFDEQQYAYEVAVDNSSTALLPANQRSIRYYAGSAFGYDSLAGRTPGIVRRVYDGNGNFIPAESGFLRLANALTTNVFLSGISAADIGNTAGPTTARSQDSSARIVMELNTNDRRRGAYGLTQVYEDSDPLGPGSSPETGFVVSNVTPPGMTGRVSSMAYGGKRAGINFNQVLFVGTTTGQLWIRGEFGTTFTSSAPGTGAVTDIAVDPDDYRHAFIVQNGEVFETSNLGVSWRRVSDGLVSPPSATTGLPSGTGLTTQVYTIALFDPNPGTANVGAAGDVVLLAGGRGGVYRRTITQCGTGTVWSEYGNGLPNTVVTDLDVQGARLTVGTFGRGVWTIDNVFPTLSTTLYLNIIGDAAANNITIAADPLDPNAVIVSDGLGLNQRFQFGQFDVIRVFGLGGADTLRVGSASVPGTSLKFVNYPILADLGGNPGDRIVVNASGDTANIRATITPTTIGAGPGDTLFSGCGYIYTNPLPTGSLVLFTGSGNDSITYTGGSPLPGVLVALGGAGNDNYRFLNAGPTSAYIYDSAGIDAVVATVPAGTMAIADDPNKRVVAGGVDIFMDAGIESVLLDGQGAGATLGWYGSDAADNVTLMEDPGGPATWSQLLSQRQLVRFRNMTYVSVNTFGGADLVRISSNGAAAGGSTQFVRYAVVTNLGGNPGDTLLIDSSSSAANIRAGVTASTVGANLGVDNLFGSNGYVFYTGLSSGGAMYLATGSGNDELFLDAGAVLAAEVNTGAGNDTVSALGTAGNDVFVVAGTTLLANNLALQPTTGVERFVVNGGVGGFDQLFTAGTAGSDALGIYQTDVRGAVLTGLPVTTQYTNLSSVNLDGSGGFNSLDWVDISERAFGTPIDPASGLVFAPTGPTSGNLTVGGAAGTTTRISNVAGTFALYGDPSGTNTRDVFTILGTSSSAFASAYGEISSPDGADVIFASDAGVSVNNAVFGLLKPVVFGRTPGGALGFSSVFVRGGNETGQGDTFFATTTTRTNLVLDGGEPATAPGDTLNITTNGAASSAFTDDPAFGPPQTRVVNRIDGGAVGYLNFENVSAGFTGTTPGGPTIPSFTTPIVQLFAAGSDAGFPSQVRVFNPDGGLRFIFEPFPGFTGGTKVATGDVTGDGVTDIVAAAGPGAAPHVKVFDGATGGEVYSFYAVDPAYTGGITVATGLVNADRFADIVIGTGAGAESLVRVLDGSRLGQLLPTGEISPFAELSRLIAFPGYNGGVNVAAGDLNGDGGADVIVGTAVGVPVVAGFDGRTTAPLVAGFVPFDTSSDGVNVAAGDIDGDGRADIIAGAGPGGPTLVRVFASTGAGPIREFEVNDPTIPGTPPIPITSGVRVAAGDLDGDGLAEVVVGRGPGSRPFAQFLKVSNNVGTFVSPVLTSLLAVNVFGDSYSNGIYVGA